MQETWKTTIYLMYNISAHSWNNWTLTVLPYSKNLIDQMLDHYTVENAN